VAREAGLQIDVPAGRGRDAAVRADRAREAQIEPGGQDEVAGDRVVAAAGQVDRALEKERAADRAVDVAAVPVRAAPEQDRSLPPAAPASRC
jgi:hypothetical protein